MIYGLSALCAVACALLVAAEYRRAATLRVIAKVIASLAFLAVGISARQSGDYGTWIVVGLAFGVAGDIALLGEGNGAFLGGLVAFLIGHVAYVVAIAALVPPAHWIDRAGVLALVPLAVAATVLVQMWPRLGALRAPVIVYVGVIVTMVVGAIAQEHNQLLVAGAILFFVSDIAVARDKFLGASFANKLWGLPAYYAGQLLIAWSLS